MRKLLAVCCFVVVGCASNSIEQEYEKTDRELQQIEAFIEFKKQCRAKGRTVIKMKNKVSCVNTRELRDIMINL